MTISPNRLTKNSYSDDNFRHKSSHILPLKLPLSDIYFTTLDAERLHLRELGVKSSISLPHKIEALYKVAITTADIKEAGMGVPVFISIRGDKGNLPRTKLKKSIKSKRKSTPVKFNPGSTQIFPLDCQDLGDLESLLIEHEGLEPKDSWLLQGVEIMNTENKKIWLFTCNHWLSLYKEDGKVSRELFAFKSMKTKYEIVVITGDVPGAETDSQVFLTLCGRTGISPQMRLNNEGRNCFTKGQSNIFTISATCVGPISKIKIRIDPSGSKPNWYLDRVCITDLKHPDWRYFFQCKNWFSSSIGDGALCREIRGTKEITGIAMRTDYKISIYTANKPGAGTKAQVSLQIFGEYGESDVLRLRNHEGLKEGSVYEQITTMKQLGTLKEIRIGHDNRGPQPDWFLDKVIINDLEMSRVFEFPCAMWFSDVDGEKLTRVLEVKKKPRITKKFKYQMNITTGNRSNAHTSSKIYVSLSGPEQKDKLKGKIESSGRIWIEGAKFAKGRTDVVMVDLEEMLSPVTELVAGISPSGKRPDWFLDDIVVFCPETETEQFFICGDWLSAENYGSKTEIVLVEDKSRRKVKGGREAWKIEIQTSDIKDSGTTANITMVLYGKDGKSDNIELPIDKPIDRNSILELSTELMKVGLPYKLRVEHDNSGYNPSWHLDNICMTHLPSGNIYQFDCGRWLSDSHDDKSVVREIPATGPNIKKKAPVCHYKVQVFTGNDNNAATDANVFINLFGDLGDTGNRRLFESDNDTKFEKNQMDEFVIEAVGLGTINKIKLGHQSQVLGTTWLVDKVVVTEVENESNCKTFACNCWFDSPNSEGLTIKEFVETIMPGNVTYDVIVKTGTKTGAGTDANVFISIFGSIGDTGKVQLKSSSSSKNKFENGASDVFQIESEDIGKIKGIKLSHDNTGAASAWLVEQVVINDPKNGLKYTFLLNKWLDGKMSSIDCEPSKIDKIDKTVTYRITVYTGNQMSAGTDAKVFVQIYGIDNKTDELVLKNGSDCFERGNKDLFKINAIDVGFLQKIRIGHNGKKPGAGWFLDKVSIEKLSQSTEDLENNKSLPSLRDSNGETDEDSDELSNSMSISSRSVSSKSRSLKGDAEKYWFFCRRWLAVDEDDGMIVRELLSSDENGKFLSNLEELEYKVSVKTGNVSGAGTDANVFLSIFGNKSDSGERALKKPVNSTINKFEKNSLDIFMIKAIELGSLKKIKIRHDDQGGAAAWFLEYVLINDQFNEYLFPCYSWLAKNMGDGLISRDIFVATPDVHLDWQKGNLTLDKIKIYQEDQLEKYEVNVYTSKKAMSGTDANVHIVLYGDKINSGSIPLKTSLTHSNKFESGNCDRFIIKSADIGALKKIKIGHDNSLAGADWHLEKVEVEALKLGQTWVFPCNEWISKTKGDGKLEKELYAQSQLTITKRPRVTYEITTYTSNISGAGTSANVYIQIYGRKDCTEQRLLANEIERPNKFKKGSVDAFYLEMEDMEDPIEKIRIGHDGKGISAGWHLTKVIVKRITPDKSNSIAYQFPCNRWLAKNEDDHAIERELLADQITRSKFSPQDKKSIDTVDGNVSLSQMKKYLIRVYTGDETGLNSNVFLKIFGENGDTGERPLTYSKNNKTKFQKNKMDEFEWEAVDLGKLEKVDIKHDNSGLINKDWFLKKVEVVDIVDNETYMFQCERWLSKSKEDGKIMRTLYAKGFSGERSLSTSGRNKSIGSTDSLHGVYDSDNDEDSADEDVKKIPYTITVKTGPEKHMGSSGPLWVRFYGARDLKTRKIRLQKLGSDYFAPNSKEIMSIEAADVGNITKVEVTNDGVDKKSGWYLHSISIALPTTGKSYYLPCETWLSYHEGDRKATRIFNVVDKMISKFIPKITYELTIYTGDCENAGTNSSLFIQIFGVKGQTSVYSLDKSGDNFERDRIDRLRMEMEDVGEIKQVRIQNDAKGIRPHWFLEKIEIMTDKKYEFVFNDYLSTQLGQTRLLTVDLKSDSSEKKCSYSISVKTSNLKSANTTASVFVKFFGENGDSGELALNKPDKPGKLFQVDQLNVFTFSNMLNLGDLTRCQIWHDYAGFGASWHLEYVEIKEINTKRLWRFPCNKWLSQTEDDKQVFRELICNSAPEFGKRKPKETVYEVTVTTSDKKDAGMPDNLWLVLSGTLGYSGDCLMENSVKNKLFSKGNVDLMKYKTNYLGELTEILIGAVKNQKSDIHRSRWYCHEIQVKDPVMLKIYTFEVRAWIDVDDRINKHNGKSFTPAKIEEDKTKVKASEIRKKGIIHYEVCVVTGNEFASGTNAKVFITMFSDDMDSGRRPLIQKGKNIFGRGQEDKFILESADLGEITKVKIEHDDTGMQPDWLLDRIQITNQLTNKIWRFPCGEWLSKSKGDQKLWKLLTPT